MLPIGQRERELKSDRRLVYLAAGLIVLSVPIGTWVVYRSFEIVHVSQLSVFLLVVIGFALYAFGRGDLLKQRPTNQAVSTLLFIFGAFFLVYGPYISFWALDSIEFSVNVQPLTNQNAVLSGVFDLVWSSLWIVLGVLLVVDSLHLPIQGVKGAMLSATSFVILWHMTVFEVHTGGRLGNGLFSYFLGYPLYLVLSAVMALLIIAGLLMSALSVWKKVHLTGQLMRSCNIEYKC